jgi:WD40 repeat protein
MSEARIDSSAYENFDIHVGAGQGGRYPVTAVSKLFGETEQISWQELPSGDEFTDLLTYLRDRVARPDDAREFGQILHQFLFPRPVRNLYERTWGAARTGGTYLRIRLHLRVQQPELNELPWEYCHDEKSYLALNVTTPLVRYIATDEPPQSITAPRALRVLVIMATPQDWPKLDLASEENNIREGLEALTDSQQVEIKIEPAATREIIRQHLTANESPDIIHFAGHGDVAKDGKGAVVLQDNTGGSDLVDASDLFHLLRGSSAKLLVLSACKTAAHGEHMTSSQPIKGVAQELVRAGIPAVIGMQFAVPDQTAVSFMSELYRRLAEGIPLDVAVTHARLAVRFDRKQGEEQEKLFWGIPVLFMRSPDGVIWRSRTDDPPAEPVEQLPNPYLGLLPFREEHAHLFFGRSTVADQLVTAVQRQPFVAVIGASGSGKSSVAFAGLVPRLSGEGDWLIIDCRPGEEPILALAAALTQKPVPEQNGTEQMVAAMKLARALEDGDESLPQMGGRLRSDGQRFLLIIDQFEELYTRCNDVEKRKRFLDLLLAFVAVESANSHPKNVLAITMRADFLAQALAYRPFADALQNSDLKLGPMNREELRQAVEQPVAGTGVAFEVGLVERILDDVGQEPGNLPLLEFTLESLWEHQRIGRLTHAAYETIGRVEGALADHADRVQQQLMIEGVAEDQIQRVLVQLVQMGEGTEDTRRVATRVELGDGDWLVIQVLADARLVVTRRDEKDQETAELAHEALIRRWKTLQIWIEEDRTFRLWQQRLQPLARQWQTSDHKEGALLQADIPLNEAAGWLERRHDDLVGSFRKFVVESLAHRDIQTREKEAARRRQLRNLRIGIGVVLVMLAITLVFFAVARNAQSEAVEARETAVFDADSRATAEAEALTREAQATAALGREAEALAIARTKEAEAFAAVDAEATARARSEDSEARAQEQAQIALARKLAAEAISVIESESDTELALLLSVEAVRTVANTSLTYDEQAGEALQRVLQAAPIAIHRHADLIQELVYSPDGSKLASASQDGQVQLVDTESGAIRTQLAHDGRVNVLAFSPDSRFLATAGQDGRVHIVGNGSVATISHDGPVNALAFSPDGGALVTAGDDGIARVVNVEQAETVEELDHGYPLLGVVFGPRGHRLAVMSDTDQARLWDTSTWTSVANLPHNDRVRELVFDPAGRRLASRSYDFSVTLWDASNGENLASVQHANWVTEIHFSPDGRRLASASQDGTAVLISTDTGEQLGILQHDDTVATMTFNADGSRLATASFDGLVRLWNTTTGEIVRSYPHEGPVWRVSLSPDEKQLAAAVAFTDELSSETHVWDVATGVKLLVLRSTSTTGILDLGRLEEGISTTLLANAEYTVDGMNLVTRRLDGFVQIWDVSSRTLRRVLSHGDAIDEFTLHPQGSQIATAGGDMTVRLWPMDISGMGEEDAVTEADMGELVSRACSIVSRNLSPSEWELYLADEEFRPTCPGLPSD